MRHYMYYIYFITVTGEKLQMQTVANEHWSSEE